MRPKIRPFRREDKPALVQILRHTPEFTPEEVGVAEEVLDEYLMEPDHSGYHVFVAELGSLITGYICYGATPLTEGTWDIYWMAVAREHKGQGIGKRLLAFAEDQIRKAKGRLSLIETSSKPEYEGTRRFHESQGYQQVCRIEDFYAPGDDKLIFRKRFK